MRTSWDDYFLNLAAAVSSRSTCLRRQVGAVAVRSNHILSTGYNGAPSGLAHCLEIGCLRDKLKVPSGERHELCRASHAEMNCITQAAKTGTALEGATIYCTHQPCVLCVKLIINVHIKRVVYRNPYPDEMALGMLKEADIQVCVIS